MSPPGIVGNAERNRPRSLIARLLEAPPERLAALRILVGIYASLYLLIRTPHLWSYGLDDLTRFEPVGIVALASEPMLPSLYRACVLAVLVLSVPFLLGYRFRILAPVFAVGLLFILTHSNSWGKVLHTDNLLVFYVMILSVTPAADVWSFDHRDRRVRKGKRPAASYGWGIRLMIAVCALVYLLAGIAKVRNSGLDFVDGMTLRNYVAFDNVRKLELGSIHSPLGAWLLPYAGVFSGFAWLSLLLELAAPLAVVSRRFGRIWAILIWGFHVGVLALMAIAFLFQITFVAFFPFFRSERFVEGALSRWRRFRSAPGGDTDEGERI